MGGQLTFPNCSRASLLGSLPVSLVHILSPVDDNCPFLNQRKGDNGRRNCFMTIREDGIRDRPHTRRTRIRPSYHAQQKNLKVGELFMQYPPMSGVRNDNIHHLQSLTSD